MSQSDCKRPIGEAHIYIKVCRVSSAQIKSNHVTINCSVAYYGRKVGCPTPMNDKVVDIIHMIEEGELIPGFDNPKFL